MIPVLEIQCSFNDDDGDDDGEDDDDDDDGDDDVGKYLVFLDITKMIE